LKLPKKIEMVYKDFYNFKPPKILQILKKLVGIPEELLSSSESFHSEIGFENRPNNAFIHEQIRKTKSEMPKKKKECQLF